MEDRNVLLPTREIFYRQAPTQHRIGCTQIFRISPQFAVLGQFRNMNSRFRQPRNLIIRDMPRNSAVRLLLQVVSLRSIVAVYITWYECC